MFKIKNPINNKRPWIVTKLVRGLYYLATSINLKNKRSYAPINFSSRVYGLRICLKSKIQ